MLTTIILFLIVFYLIYRLVLRHNRDTHISTYNKLEPPINQRKEGESLSNEYSKIEATKLKKSETRSLSDSDIKVTYQSKEEPLKVLIDKGKKVAKEGLDTKIDNLEPKSNVKIIRQPIQHKIPSYLRPDPPTILPFHRDISEAFFGDIKEKEREIIRKKERETEVESILKKMNAIEDELERYKVAGKEVENLKRLEREREDNWRKEDKKEKEKKIEWERGRKKEEEEKEEQKEKVVNKKIGITVKIKTEFEKEKQNEVKTFGNRFERITITDDSENEKLQRLSLHEIQILRSKVTSWRIKGDVPCFSMYNYYPTNHFPDVSTHEWDVRKKIWNFKYDPSKTLSSEHDIAMKSVIRDSEKVLKHFFGSYTSKLTLVCITASTKHINMLRHEEFSNRLCGTLSMRNGYKYINITEDGTPKHLGGNGKPELSFNSSFFKDKNILLFDDVVTSGGSIASFKRQLEECGANVIGALTIGKTKHEREGRDPIKAILL